LDVRPTGIARTARCRPSCWAPRDRAGACVPWPYAAKAPEGTNDAYSQGSREQRVSPPSWHARPAWTWAARGTERSTPRGRQGRGLSTCRAGGTGGFRTGIPGSTVLVTCPRSATAPYPTPTRLRRPCSGWPGQSKAHIERVRSACADKTLLGPVHVGCPAIASVSATPNPVHNSIHITFNHNNRTTQPKTPNPPTPNPNHTHPLHTPTNQHPNPNKHTHPKPIPTNHHTHKHTPHLHPHKNQNSPTTTHPKHTQTPPPPPTPTNPHHPTRTPQPHPTPHTPQHKTPHHPPTPPRRTAWAGYLGGRPDA